MFLLVNTTQVFNYHATDESKTREANADMRGSRSFLKIKHFFNWTETATSNHGVIENNTMQDTPWKRKSQTKSDSNPAKKVEI